MIRTMARGAPAPLISTLMGAALLGGGAAAMALRLATAGGPRGGSVLSVTVFSAALVLLATAAGWRASLPSLRGVCIGIVGAAVLCAVPVWLRLGGAPHGGAGPGYLLGAFVAGVVAISVAEEVLLRGALFDVVEKSYGPTAAVVVAAIAFAMLHVPLYGWSILPLDLAVGMFLGALRVVSGRVSAPATAHALADVAAWWLR